MRFVEEYRDPELAQRLARRIASVVKHDWRIMEVCGGQTHSIIRFGLDQLLPPSITLIHGPGCPVCVTPLEMIDRAYEIACRPDVIFCSFGDMLRVPGSRGDLMSARASGADVRIVYSPADAVAIAEAEPDNNVVFFAVGFETTAPANAGAVEMARLKGLTNFSLLVSHVLVPPAIEAIMNSPDTAVNGFLAAGHVCTIVGTEEYEELARQYQIPIVVTGFEPLDVLHGVLLCVEALEEGRPRVINQYARSVRASGNTPAMEMVRKVFRRVDRKWRGIGAIPSSGLELQPDYARFDAESIFGVSSITADEPSVCISGKVLQGLRRPTECPAFATECTPEHPLGATMVSAEGACSAYYRYRRGLAPADSHGTSTGAAA